MGGNCKFTARVVWNKMGGKGGGVPGAVASALLKAVEGLAPLRAEKLAENAVHEDRDGLFDWVSEQKDMGAVLVACVEITKNRERAAGLERFGTPFQLAK